MFIIRFLVGVLYAAILLVAVLVFVVGAVYILMILHHDMPVIINFVRGDFIPEFFGCCTKGTG